MKIVHVLNRFLPEQTAGTEVYVFALSKYLKKIGIKTAVVIPNFGMTYSDDYVYDGIDVHRFSETTVVNRKLIMGFSKPEGLSALAQFLEYENPDIIHFHELAGSNGIGLEHVKLAKSTGAKIVMTFHLVGYSCSTSTLVQNGKILCGGVIDEYSCGSCSLKSKGMFWLSSPIALVSQISKKMGIDFRKFDHPVGTLLGTAHVIDKLKGDLFALINLCDHVVCLTNWYQNILIRNGIDAAKIALIEQGLPLAYHRESETLVPDINRRPLKLMFLGRISALKGLHLLLDALLELPADSFELSIYGNSESGQYENNLRKKTSNMSNINWLGKLDQADVVKTMSNHDVLCLCSTISEMSPLVIQEARAAGIPVLASNVNGNYQQIKHGVNGLLFDFHSVASLKNQINRLIENPILLNQLKSNTLRPRIFEEVGHEYVNLYNKLICGS